MHKELPPFTVDEILNKPNTEIVAFINGFDPKDAWEEPSISGLATVIEQAVALLASHLKNI